MAYDALRSALAEAPLEPDDLHRFADAAWWLGLTTDCIRLTEEAHRRYLDTGHVEEAALATTMLPDAGFTNVRLHDLEDDPFNTYCECRRD